MFNDDRIQKTSITAEDWILGQVDAPVTLLEYGDLECPYCAAARPALEELVADYPDTIQLVFRHFPITASHPHAFIAAEAAEAAGAEGMFWEMVDTLFTHQDRLEIRDLRRYARELGLDVARFDREMRNHTYRDEVKQDFRQGVLDGVNGTPTIFINRVRYDGPREYDAMLAAIATQTEARL